MALSWEKHLQALSLDCQRIDYKFEQGGLLLKFNSFSGYDPFLIRSDQLASERRERESLASANTRVDKLLSELEAVKQSAANEKGEAQQAVEELKQEMQLWFLAEPSETAVASSASFQLDVHRCLWKAPPHRPLLIPIPVLDDSMLLEVRWRSSLQICSRLIGLSPWGVSSLLPTLEAYGSVQKCAPKLG